MRRSYETAVLNGVRDYLSSYLLSNCEEYGVDVPALVEVGQSFVLAGTSVTPAVIIASGNTRNDGSPYFARMEVTVYFALADKEQKLLEEHLKAWKDLIMDAIRDDWTLGGSCLKAEMDLDAKDSCDGQFASMAIEMNLLIDLGGFVHEEN